MDGLICMDCITPHLTWEEQQNTANVYVKMETGNCVSCGIEKVVCDLKETKEKLK